MNLDSFFLIVALLTTVVRLSGICANMESVQENNKSPGEKAEKVEERTDSINKNSSPSTSSTSDTNSRLPYSWMVS